MRSSCAVRPPAGSRVALDALTDALVLVGQHGVYCTSSRNPAVPKLDLQAVLAGIGGAKELVAGAMDHLRKERTTADFALCAYTGPT